MRFMPNNIDWTTVHDYELYTDSEDDRTTADAKIAEEARRAQELRIQTQQVKEERRKRKAEERERQRLFEEKRKKEQEQAAATEERRRVKQEATAVTKAQAPAPAAVTMEEYKAHPGSQKVTACVPCPVPRKKRGRSDAKEGSEEGGPKAGRRWRQAQAGLLKVAPKKRARTAGMTDVSGASALDNESGDDEEKEEEVVPDELFEVAKDPAVGELTDVLFMLVKKCEEWIELEREKIDFQREMIEEMKKSERGMNQMADVQREQLEEMKRLQQAGGETIRSH